MSAIAPVTPELPSQAGAAADEQPKFSRGYRAWLLTMLVLVSALNLADRQGLPGGNDDVGRDPPHQC